MHAAVKLLLPLFALSACSSGGEQTQPANNAASGDVDVLPVDESAATPTNELANGSAEPQGNTAEVAP